MKYSEMSISSLNPLCGLMAAGVLLLACWITPLPAQPISVANPSFESQIVNPFPFPVDFRVDNWQKPPKPDYFTDSPQLTWDQTVGLFINPPIGDPNRYLNLDGNQAAYVLSLPQAGLFQDNQSLDWNSTVGGLNATYEVGYAYQFTLGVFGKQMVEDFSSLQLSLFYRDGANLVTIGTPTTIVFNTTTFDPAGPFNLIDYSVTTPFVQASDPWAGQNIGLRIESVLGTGQGYWDIDNVRLTAVVPEPGAFSLLALGFGGLLFAGWRRRQS